MTALYKLSAINTATNQRIEYRGYIPETRKPLYQQLEILINELNLGEENMRKSRCMIYGTDRTRRVYENGYIDIERRYHYDN